MYGRKDSWIVSMMFCQEKEEQAIRRREVDRYVFVKIMKFSYFHYNHILQAAHWNFVRWGNIQLQECGGASD
jgi:hypothetical protein